MNDKKSGYGEYLTLGTGEVYRGYWKEG